MILKSRKPTRYKEALKYIEELIQLPVFFLYGGLVGGLAELKNLKNIG